jgi:hypothetical protein
VFEKIHSLYFKFRNQNSCCNEKRAQPWMTDLRRPSLFVKERVVIVDSLSRARARVCGGINSSVVFTGVTPVTAHKTELDLYG